MKVIFNSLLVVLIFIFAISLLFVVGNSNLKDRIFYLVTSVVLLLCIIGVILLQMKLTVL